MMSTDEALRLLFSRRGWWRGSGLPEGTARSYKKRFFENSLEMETRMKILLACGFQVARELQWKAADPSEGIRLSLERELRKMNAFWSFQLPDNMPVPDDLLIEKVLLHLDIQEIRQLFILFDSNRIRKIWKKRMLPLGTQYDGLNRLYAFLFFGIKHPDRYLRDHAKNQIGKL